MITRALAILLLTVATFAHGSSEDPPVRFTFINVYVSAVEPLAAYQVELHDDAHAATIVGIEGGEHPAFTAPPFYDPAAMSGERVILAAFTTQADLPVGRTRVARVHVQITGMKPPSFVATLTTAGTIGAKKINATVQIAEGVGS